MEVIRKIRDLENKIDKVACKPGDKNALEKYLLALSVSRSPQKHPGLSYHLVARVSFAALIVFSSGSPVPLCVPIAGVLLLPTNVLFSHFSNPCLSLFKKQTRSDAI